MEIIDVTLDNLAQEHICCALSDKKGECGVADKKAWLAQRLEEGLVFKKLDVRGKAFIEYLPAEAAWCPLDAPGYLYIDCFWVAGQYKGQGYGRALLEACLADTQAKGKAGLVALSSAKKRSYLSDGAYLKGKGFLLADTAAPYFELLYLPLRPDAPIPQFKPCAKEGRIEQTGLVLYYTHQCPFAANYAARLPELAAERGVALKAVRLSSGEEARNAPTAFTTFSLFDQGQLVTHEIMNEKKLDQYLQRRG